MRIRWSGPALNDLRSLRTFTAESNSPAAERQVDRILIAASGLVVFPESGRPGRLPGTRELVVGKTPYLVAYRLERDTVEILRVFHSRQR